MARVGDESQALCSVVWLLRNAMAACRDAGDGNHRAVEPLRRVALRWAEALRALGLVSNALSSGLGQASRAGSIYDPCLRIPVTEVACC